MQICEQISGDFTVSQVIQISGSASLYYVVKSEIKANINIKMKKKILSTLLNGMFTHKNDAVMMRNGCLTLCQFSIPQDVVSTQSASKSPSCTPTNKVAK